MPEPLVTYPTTSTCGFRLGGRLVHLPEGGEPYARADVGLGPALTESTPGPPAGTEPQAGRETNP